MTIELYQNKSDAIYLNKTIQYYATLTGTLRDSCSLLNPIILFEYSEGDKIWLDVVDENNDDVVDENNNELGFYNEYNILDANYCYIKEFKRYYYITNITCITNKVYSISMAVDVLMSYKDDILDLDAFVTRNENTYDAYVKDEMVSYYYDKDVFEYTLVKGSKVNTNFKSNLALFDNNAIITAINTDVDSFNTDYAIPPTPYLPYVYNNTAGATFTSMSYSADSVAVNHLMKCVIDDDDLSTYIISITLYPFRFDKGAMNYLKLGDTKLDDVGNNKDVPVYDLISNVPQYLVVANFKYEGNHNFMDYEPYSNYELFIPYLSYIPISADDLLNNEIIVYYVPNYTTGKAQVYVMNLTQNKIIYTSTCQLGNKLSISTTNAKEVIDNNINNGINLGIGLLSAGIGVATGNPLAVAGGVLSAGKSITSFVQNMNTNYSKANGNASDGLSGLYMYQDVRLRITSYKPKDYDANWFKLNGRPLNKYVKLSTLTGYTRVGDVHLNNWNSTLDEQDALRNMLLNGIVI